MLRVRVPRVAGSSTGAYALTINVASFTVTAQSVNLVKSSVLPIDAASYAVTAQNVNFVYSPANSYTLPVDVTSYGVTFQTVGLLKTSVLPVTPAAYTVTAQNVTLTYTPAGSGATPAQIWAYELLPGVSAGQMLIALYQSACPTAAQNAAAVIAAMNATPPGVDVRKVNGYTVDGSGTQADPWGPA